MRLLQACLALLMLLTAAHAGASDPANLDPMGTAAWPQLRAELFGAAPVVLDGRVSVIAPAIAEDPLQVPVAVRVDPSVSVRRVLVFADYNPIVRTLGFVPHGASAYLAFRLKMQQSGPVRAAALDAYGVWHLGHAWVSTTGGGCTLPALGRGEPDWERHLNRVTGRLWPHAERGRRVRFRIVHPMDTGLAPGIPAFHLTALRLADAGGAPLMDIEPYEPVSENPVFTLEVRNVVTPLVLGGTDNNGNRVRAEFR